MANTPTRTSNGHRSAAFWGAAAMLLVALASSSAPSPIYPIYAQEWHLSSVQLTLAFAIYVAGLLISLLCAGALSDYVGRRPVLIAGFSALAVSLLLFVVADGFALLIVARTLQGFAIGSLFGALGATLLENAPPKRPALASLLNGVIPPFALAVGALSSGALVEWGPFPERLVYLIFAVVSIALLSTVPLAIKRVAVQPGALRSLIPTVAVQPASRSLFRTVVGSLIASWALGGLYLSLVPSVLREEFGVTNHFAAGALIGLFTAVGGITGLLIQLIDMRISVIIGLAALIIGTSVTLLALLGASMPWLIVGTAIAGVGFGAGFQAALRLLLATADPKHTAGLLSTIYVASYLAFGLPSVIAGAFEPHVGLLPAITGYGIFVVLAAAIALVLQFTSKRSEEVEEEAAKVMERTATGSIRVADAAPQTGNS